MGIQINGQTDTISAFDNNFSLAGNVSIGGTLTYEDVTSVDAVGLSTFQAGIQLDDSITHLGDTDTKIRFPAADTITVETAGSERVRITSGGNIGIGTDNPVGSLEVRDSKANLIVAKDGLTVKSNSDLATQYDLIQLGAGGVLASYSTATATADTQFIHNAYRHSGGQWKYRYADTAMRFRMNSPGNTFIFESAANGSADANITFSEKLRIDSAGRMLLGTTTEGAVNADNFTVADSGNCGITIRSGTSNSGNLYFSDATSGTGEFDGAIAYEQTDNRMMFYTASTERLRITSGGQLNLAGNMQFTAANPEIELNNGGPRFRVPSANTLTIHTGGGLGATSNERLRINSAGNIGIGDNSPSQKLNVAGNIMLEGADQFMYLSNVGTGNAGIYVRGNTSGSFLRSHTTGMFTWEVTGSEKMRLNADGAVTKPYNPSANWSIQIPNPANHVRTFTEKRDAAGNLSGENAGNGSSHGSVGRFTAPVAGTYLFTIRGTLTTGSNLNNELLSVYGSWSSSNVLQPNAEVIDTRNAVIGNDGFGMAFTLYMNANDYWALDWYRPTTGYTNNPAVWDISTVLLG